MELLFSDFVSLVIHAPECVHFNIILNRINILNLFSIIGENSMCPTDLNRL